MSLEVLQDEHAKGDNSTNVGQRREEEVANHEKDIEETPADEESNDLEKHLSRKGSRKTKLTVEVYPSMDLDNGIVGWESQDDPLNPRNFPENQKWTLLVFVSLIAFLSPLVSSIFAPGISFINRDFHNTSQYLAAFSISVFVLGFAFGPLFLSPLSEIYGRRLILNLSNIFFVAFNLGCALAPNLNGLIAMRLLAGIGGSACLTIGSGVISDLFLPEQRGLAISVYGVGMLFGPVLGPILGGFIAQRAGWRWCFWVVFITSAVCVSVLLIFNRETNPTVLIKQKTNRLRKELNRPDLLNTYTKEQSAPSLRWWNVLLQGLVVPMKLLFGSPIVFLLSLYVAFVYGLLFLLLTTITGVYINTYSWSPELCGLAYLGVGLGNFVGMIFVAKTSDITIIRLAKRNNNVYEPEMRLPTCVFFGFLIPISFFWYGWSTKAHAHWVVPIIGLFPFGAGTIGIMFPIQMYLIDAFPRHAASAVAALTAVRCLFGAVLPLAAPNRPVQ
ncbi:hypothetical protein DL767_007122 [Monosporascus sp. MG133]|nr:hypothetical protein DL767_007122 [Monosporascus sp. MG133]